MLDSYKSYKTLKESAQWKRGGGGLEQDFVCFGCGNGRVAVTAFTIPVQIHFENRK